jgi:predicted Zn finger-like uncharacterized protein
MQLICPNCASSYSVADGALGETGRSVRCVKCKHVWFATPAKPEPAMAMAEEESGHSDPLPPPVPEDRPPEEMAAPTDENRPAVPGEGASPPEVDDAPPIAPETEVSVEANATASPRRDRATEFLERRKRIAAQKLAGARGLRSSAGGIAAVLAGILVALIYEREFIVRVLPQTASLYAKLGLTVNLRGLAFLDVKSAMENQDGIPVLVVEGDIRNVSSVICEVPQLRFAMRNIAGAEIYSWTAVPDRNLMTSGDVQHFRARLASPPAGGNDLNVRFVQPRDMPSAAKH